jgi:hypothetical protein
MARYSFATTTTGFTAATAAWEIFTTASDRALLLEIGWSKTVSPASAWTFGIGRPAAIGVTPTSPVTFLAEDPASPAGTVESALAWGTGPTAPANFFKRDRFFHRKFQIMSWIFPNGVIIAVSKSIVLWNIATSEAAEVYAVVNE